MRRILSIFLSIVLLAVGCDDPQLEKKIYPYILMNDIQATSESVVFTAEFISLGNRSIDQYGFIWTPEGSTNPEEIAVRKISKSPELGKFSLLITTDLVAGVTYEVRPFAQSGTLRALGGVMTFKSPISSNRPALFNFQPASGGAGDIITIKGSSFSTRSEVFVGDDKCVIISASPEEIKVKLPDHLTRSGEVPLIVISPDVHLQANEYFKINGHTVVSFSPTEGIIGETEFVISGTGFLETGTKVFIGGIEAMILDESETAIKVRLPYDMKVGVAGIEVVIDRQVAEADGEFTVKSRWKRLADFPGANRLNPAVISLGDYIYIIGGSSGFYYSAEGWRYDINNDTWQRLPDFPGGGRWGGSCFAIGDKIYYGLGSPSSGDFWSYDTQTGEWTRTLGLVTDSGSAPFPLTCSIDGKGYLLMGGANGIISFTEEDGWDTVGTAGEMSINGNYDNYFEADGNSYVLDLVNSSGEESCTIYKVNRSSPFVWDNIYQFPFDQKIYQSICFGLNNYAYIGDGMAEYVDRKFFKLNLTTHELTRIENFQGDLIVRGGVSMQHNNKGYAGLGSAYSFDYTYLSNEFWMYDPEIN